MFRKIRLGVWAVMLIALVQLGGVSSAHAFSTIDSADILSFPDPPPFGSGNGQLDIIVFSPTNGAGVNENADSTALPGFPTGIDVDDANTDMPGGSSTSTSGESWVTSMGDLQNFYKYTFPDGSGGSLVNELLIFVDVHETGPTNQFDLNTLSLWSGYTSPAVDPTGSNDIDRDTQNGIENGFSGGTLEAALDTTHSLVQVNPGEGFPDVIIFTGINPFSFSANTKLLINWASSAHDGGGDKAFLSGTYRAQDFRDGDGGSNAIPEPGSLLLMGSGLLSLLGFGSHRKRS